MCTGMCMCVLQSTFSVARMFCKSRFRCFETIYNWGFRSWTVYWLPPSGLNSFTLCIPTMVFCRNEMNRFAQTLPTDLQSSEETKWINMHPISFAIYNKQLKCTHPPIHPHPHSHTSPQSMKRHRHSCSHLGSKPLDCRHRNSLSC